MPLACSGKQFSLKFHGQDSKGLLSLAKHGKYSLQSCSMVASPHTDSLCLWSGPTVILSEFQALRLLFSCHLVNVFLKMFSSINSSFYLSEKLVKVLNLWWLLKQSNFLHLALYPHPSLVLTVLLRLHHSSRNYPGKPQLIWNVHGMGLLSSKITLLLSLSSKVT